MSNETDNVVPELMPQLELLIGDNRQQWAEIATNLHAWHWCNAQPTVAELFGVEIVKPEFGRGSVPLIQAAFHVS